MVVSKEVILKGWALVEYGGEWEDSWERIIKVYLKKEKAERVMQITKNRIDEREEKYGKCMRCEMDLKPYLIENYEEFIQFKEKSLEHCPRAKFVWQLRSDGHEAVCKNEIDDYYYDISGYLLREVKVDIEQ